MTREPRVPVGNDSFRHTMPREYPLMEQLGDSSCVHGSLSEDEVGPLGETIHHD